MGISHAGRLPWLRPRDRIGDDRSSPSPLRQRRARWTAIVRKVSGTMAIYRMSAQVISRSSGRSATAAAAYRCGGRITDERTGQIHDYERRSGVLHEEVMAPPDTPEWMLDREALWNAIEKVEKRRDAQVCREVQLALPHELNHAEQLQLVRGFVGREFVALGMVADLAIHASHRKGDPRNEHAHVLLTMRQITNDGFGPKDRSWNERALISHWREAWADHVNRALVRAGHDDRVDHRTLEAQRVDAERQAAEARAANDNEKAEALEIEAVILDREPQPKVGYIATALERRGLRTERGDLWRAVMARNFVRLRDWLSLQRDRLETAWQLVNAMFERGYGRGPAQRDHAARSREAAPSPQEHGRAYTQEERDRLLGRRPAGGRQASADRPVVSPKPKGRDRDDDRER